SLLLSWSDARLCLVSFPTRRSSDLGCIQGPLYRDTSTVTLMMFGPVVTSSASQVCCARSARPAYPTVSSVLSPSASSPSPPPTRSEEHTSELQSRFDLVCRLLLEKK